MFQQLIKCLSVLLQKEQEPFREIVIFVKPKDQSVKYTTEVELVDVEEVNLAEELRLVIIEVEDRVDDDMDVDELTDGDVVIEGDVDDTKDVDIEVDDEVAIVEVDDDDI